MINHIKSCPNTKETTKNTTFKNIETGEDFKIIKDRVESANVYLGLQPIVEALKQDADIIIAGRITDTSLTMAPAFYEFGWEIYEIGLFAEPFHVCYHFPGAGDVLRFQKIGVHGFNGGPTVGNAHEIFI